MDSGIMEKMFSLILYICLEGDIWGHAMQVPHEKWIVEQREMLFLKNIWFYTCISCLLIVLRDNPQKWLLLLSF